LDAEQRDGHVIQHGSFFLLEEPRLLGIDLPLHLIALGLRKREL
jgi:hypothetical protein